jgi:hypothetical protein
VAPLPPAVEAVKAELDQALAALTAGKGHSERDRQQVPVARKGDMQAGDEVAAGNGNGAGAAGNGHTAPAEDGAVAEPDTPATTAGRPGES